MAKAKTKKSASSPYYQRYQTELADIITEYQESRNAPGLFAEQRYAALNNVEQGITRHRLREYQMEALFLMDALLGMAPSQPIIKDLREVVNDETKDEAPFMSFEMATGSGKTMLMGAAMYLLREKHGITDFLVITPASTDIYQKSIRNFSSTGAESVWADDTPFTFNLITGDNYTQNLFYKPGNDANIFVFNIAKFGANANKTDKPWEEAIWKDDDGNTISIKQYLKGRRLAIITDEAHHAQTAAAQKIIKNFHPNLVLEFTATAVENVASTDTKAAKKSQTIIYKYDVRRFLEDGYGKLVRAVALASTGGPRSKDLVHPDEKLKLVTLALIHLLKHQAILLDPKARQLKPLAFVKVKEDTVYTQKVFNYLVHELADDTDSLRVIQDKILLQELQITSLLKQIWDEHYQHNPAKLRNDLRKFTSTGIFYHGASSKATEQQFREIRTNDVELVVYMQRLDEGIDLPNIFTMAVVNDTSTEFKTSVKQIIGRGIRLYKDQREFDDLDNTEPLKAAAEKLHIVCDQGKNFEEVILSIQQEFGLTNKYFGFDQHQVNITNQAKTDRLADHHLPHIRADFRARPGINLLNLVKDADTITKHFLDDNTFPLQVGGVERRCLKYSPDGFFMEVDVFADAATLHKQIQQHGWGVEKLTLTERERKAIYGIVLKTLHCLPDIPTVRESFARYITQLNDLGLHFPSITPIDQDLAAKLFVHAFSSFYRHYIEKNFFFLNFEKITDDDMWELATRFPSYELKLPQDQLTNDLRLKIKNRDQLIRLVEGSYHFYGFENSIFDYDKFDSSPEYQLAEYVNDVLKATNQQPYWVRNQRNVYFTYGSKRYYPDFIMHRDGYIFVIEVKGKTFSDVKKNTLLAHLNEAPGNGPIKGYRSLLVFEDLLDRMADDKEKWSFEKFVAEAEDFLKRKQSVEQLDQNPPAAEKYLTYIPAYSPDAAYRRFCKAQTSPKPDGWMKVPARADGSYPETVFAVQVKGNALAPSHEANAWVVLNYPGNAGGDLEGRLALVQHATLNDGYEGTTTLRIIALKDGHSTGFFAQRDLHLIGYNAETTPLIIPNIGAGNTPDIIGVEWAE
jgi:type III restriction enzyme